MKRKIVFVSLFFTIILILFGCDNNTNTSKNTAIDNKPTTATYPTNYRAGVPPNLAGYYGRFTDALGETNVFNPLNFHNKQVITGLNDPAVFDNVQYRQLSNKTYIIKGEDKHYGSNKPIYMKLTYKFKNSVMYIGIFDAEGKYNLSTYQQVTNNSKGLKWYKKYTKSQYNKFINGDSSANETDSSDTNDTEDYDTNDNNIDDDSYDEYYEEVEE